MRTNRLLLTSACLALLLCAGCDGDDGGFFPGDDSMRTYEITLENLTDSQPLSPGVIVTHTNQVELWSMGSAASEGIRLIAESGDPSTAMSMLPGAAGVDQVVMIDAPIHRIGGPGPLSATYQITAESGVDRLSIATMLICTNDGFTGLDSMALPVGFSPVTQTAMGYDAGTEANDEVSTSIVDACGAVGPVSLPADGNARPATSSTIQLHPGIQGGADLTVQDHSWNEPVLEITIRRTN